MTVGKDGRCRPFAYPNPNRPAPPSRSQQPTAFATDPVEGDANASSWGFQQLCAAVGLSAPKGSTPSRMLPGLDRNDLELFAAYLVRTKRAAQEEGLLKVLVPGDEGWGGRTAISETDRDLLRLRCTGEAAATSLAVSVLLFLRGRVTPP